MDDYKQVSQIPQIFNEGQWQNDSHSMLVSILRELRELKESYTKMDEENKKCIKSLREEIIELRKEVRELKVPVTQEVDTSMLPSLPFTTLDDLREFDTMLVLEDEMRMQLKVVIQRVGGKDMSTFLRAAIRTLICDELAVNITWRGTNEKPSIQSFTCFKMIKDVCHTKYVHGTDNDINKIAQQHFLHARDRITSKKRKVEV